MGAAAVLQVRRDGRLILAASRALPEELLGRQPSSEAIGPELDAWLLATAGDEFASVAALPLISQGNLFGVLALFGRGAEAVQGEAVWLAGAVADLAAVALGRAYSHEKLRRSYQALEESREKLARARALEAVGTMSAIVVHEVRNPLAGIHGVMQLMERRLPEGDSMRPMIGEVSTRVDELNEMLNELLQFARPRGPRFRQLDLAAMADATLDFFGKSPEGAGVEVVRQVEQVLLDADRSQLQRVLLNLLGNAAQAMGGEGVITLQVSASEGRCLIAVRDEGPGIPEAERARVFEPFFSTKTRGTGLGLPVAMQVAEAHGGTMWVTCPPEGGTVMSIELPLSRD